MDRHKPVKQTHVDDDSGMDLCEYMLGDMINTACDGPLHTLRVKRCNLLRDRQRNDTMQGAPHRILHGAARRDTQTGK